MEWNLEEAVAWYRSQGAPGDQNAVIALLREAQQAHGGSIPADMPQQLAQGLGTKPALLLALIRRIPGLRLSDRHCLEICCGNVCGKSTALLDLARKLAKDTVEVRQVSCMRMCGKGPNLRWDGQLYHGADEALLRRLLAGEK